MTEPHTHLTSRSHTKPLSYTKPLSHIKTLLIANRGEIARRILHTAQQLGLKTVAVYTEADRDALHHRLADHHVLLHDTVTTDGTRCSGYLNIAEILRAAKACNADAIHPGYGFLSENADFAQAVCDAGLRYIGPHPQTIRRLGDKVTAKAFAQKLGIPTLPAITLNADTPLDATHLPQEGWPWLVKAAAGGGGRGMRVAHSATELISVNVFPSGVAKICSHKNV
ncbi:MAG: biotin carboxylase N-terminal domain-containing protein [Gammaproteobacteria bacterium]